LCNQRINTHTQHEPQPFHHTNKETLAQAIHATLTNIIATTVQNAVMQHQLQLTTTTLQPDDEQQLDYQHVFQVLSQHNQPQVATTPTTINTKKKIKFKQPTNMRPTPTVIPVTPTNQTSLHQFFQRH
jgi:hypothetical protein